MTYSYSYYPASFVTKISCFFSWLATIKNKSPTTCVMRDHTQREFACKIFIKVMKSVKRVMNLCAP